MIRESRLGEMANGRITRTLLDLLHDMHVAAQPLTIIRTGVGYTDRMSRDDVRGWAVFFLPLK
jgi:hypothetical protein